MKIRRFIAVFLSALILCGVLTVPAAALEDPAIRAKAALLVEAETGTILYDKNIHDELSIASTTKIMSALLIFEAIDRGELRLDQQITAYNLALYGMGATFVSDTLIKNVPPAPGATPGSAPRWASRRRRSGAPSAPSRQSAPSPTATGTPLPPWPTSPSPAR